MFIFPQISFVSGTLKTVFYHIKYPQVKTGYINIVGLFAAAPQFIQTSVAIETGLVFLSALQLEDSEKKAQNIHGCALLCVCISMCVRVCTHTVHTCSSNSSVHLTLKKKDQSRAGCFSMKALINSSVLKQRPLF